MSRIVTTMGAMAVGLAVLSACVASGPSGTGDCDGLRDSLESQNGDGRLNAQDRRELRQRGC